MFSSSVIKRADLQRHDVAAVDYNALAGPPAEAKSEAGEEGFVPLTFNGPTAAESLAQAVETPPTALPAGDQVTLAEGMEIVNREEQQQQLEAQYRRGVEEGREQAERGLANVFKALRKSVAELDGLRDKVFRESEEDLLKLAIMVARKVIQQEISQQPRILANVISAAISDCSELDRITIRLNPGDYAVVAADRQGFLGNLSADTQLTLVPDETISHGGCIVDTMTGTVDARIETQLDEIYRRFMEDRSLTAADDVAVEVGQNVDQG